MTIISDIMHTARHLFFFANDKVVESSIYPVRVE